MIELPLCAVRMIRIGSLPGGIRKISTSKGCRSLKSVDSGLRPNASETSLPAPTNFPFGDDQVSSTIFVVLTFKNGVMGELCQIIRELGSGTQINAAMIFVRAYLVKRGQSWSSCAASGSAALLG